jgi:hypothetical protein
VTESVFFVEIKKVLDDGLDDAEGNCDGVVNKDKMGGAFGIQQLNRVDEHLVVKKH